MTDNNGENRNKDQNFDEKHRFVKGNNVSKGKRNRTQTDKLLFALKKAGVKRKEDFWDAVAEAAFNNREIMKAVVNKLIPTVNEFTGASGSPITFIIEKTYEQPEKGKEDYSKEAKSGKFSGL